MILNGKDIGENQRLHCRVCVIGAGAAGCTLALELARNGIDVILLEAGAQAAGKRPDDDLEGHIATERHHAPLDECRGRQLGGTTALWVGRCVPMDPIDLDRRDYVKGSGWPIRFEELARHYPRANYYCHAGDDAYDVATALSNAPSAIVPGFVDDDIVTCSRLERWSLPTHFGKHYRSELIGQKNIRLLVNSFCTRIELSPVERIVNSLTVATEPGKHFRVSADFYVVAGGGLETTRLLLASNSVDGEGIGNTSGHLGRYYMGHLFGSIAEIDFSGDPRQTIYGFERDRQGVYCRRRFWLTPEAQKKEKILNTAFWLTNPAAANPKHGSGILSAAYLALNLPYLRDILAPPAIRKAFRGAPRQDPIWPHLVNILSDFPNTAVFSTQFLIKRLIPRRRIPALFIPNRFNRYDLHYHAEQTPQWSNRVSLLDQCDRFGMPRLRVEFGYSAQDVDSVLRAHQVLADQLETHQKVGTLAYKQGDLRTMILDQARDGFHQIGTTRMSVDEREGVVDTDCKVHGVENLYLCSSSVFPTSGQANPTLTIVALAIRLADRLMSILSRR
ncbi:MAG: FAD-dependent oxidoreductase [Gammaproteobacteria bacterium]